MPSDPPPNLVPPVLPVGSAQSNGRPEAPAGGVFLQGRLHPLTLVIALTNALRNFIVPAIIVFSLGGRSSLAIVLLISLAFYLLQLLVRYFTFGYRVESGELITREGLLERRERHIPLTRVQDLRIEQGLIHRLLGVVDLRVETAGGQGAEASLSALSRAKADQLRQVVFGERRRLAVEQGTAGETLAPEPAAVLRRLTLRDLIWAGLSSNQTASVMVILLAGWQFVDDLLPEETQKRAAESLTRQVERWAKQGSEGDGATWMLVVVGIVALVLVGLVISVAGAVVLFHDFTLSRQGENLHRSYGLLTRRSSSLPRRRIQLLLVEETWLRRLFQLATLRADSAGSRPTEPGSRRDGRDVLLPAVSRAEIPSLLAEILPELRGDTAEWQDVARCAIRRGTLKGAVLCAALALLSWLVQERHLWALWPLALIPVVYLVNLLNYKHLGFALSQRFFRTRRGWLSRATYIVPVRNVQSVVLRRTPFDRRLGVGTVVVDTAGQTYTGGGPRIRNVPWHKAESVARALAHQAARVRYRS